MYLYELGEIGLLRRIEAIVADVGVVSSNRREVSLLVGIGDDAAAWLINDGNVSETLTTDTMVDKVHFNNANMSWRDVGWRSMVSNLSDIAAMGGVPSMALVTLGLPASILVEDVEDVYKGLVDACRVYEVTIVGGDLVSSPTFFISITLSGLQFGGMLLRSSASVGDLVGVTGPLGLSKAGLEVLKLRNTQLDEYAQLLIEAHIHPKPRLFEGRALLLEGVRTALDISDGLIGDLKKMMLASNLAANIFAKNLEIHPALNSIYGIRAIDIALNGGEDYELVFATSRQTMERVKDALPYVNIIGEVVGGSPGLVSVKGDQGETNNDDQLGWEHFKQ